MVDKTKCSICFSTHTLHNTLWLQMRWSFKLYSLSGWKVQQSCGKGTKSLVLYWIYWTHWDTDRSTVAPHQLTNGMAPIMKQWLLALSFSVDTVASAQRRVMKLKLTCRHWDKSFHSLPLIILLQGSRSNPAFSYLLTPSPFVRVCIILLMQTLLAQCPFCHRRPDRYYYKRIMIVIVGLWLRIHW